MMIPHGWSGGSDALRHDQTPKPAIPVDGMGRFSSLDLGRRSLLLATLIAAMAPASQAADPPGAGARGATVTVLDTPGGGIQPQAAIDDAGVIHLVSYHGQAA